MSLIEDAMLFIKVVQAGSFTQAANQLRSSKSQLSRRIANLEQRLNSQLLIRQPRGLQLSEQGEAFYQSCLTIQGQFEEATTHLQQAQQTISGQLNITAPMSLGSLYIGPLLAKFMRNYPQVRIELDLADTVKSLAESHFDIAIRAAPELPDSNLKAKKLYTYGYSIVASPDYLKTQGTPTNPQQLAQHRVITCITGANSQAQETWQFNYRNKNLTIKVNPVARVTHMWVQKKFALEGVGLIRVPNYWVQEELEAGSLKAVLKEHITNQSNIYALYRHVNQVPARITQVIDYLAKHLPSVLEN